MKICPVIMAGGAGTRLWPLSRDDKPKQFHNLSGDGTLLEETINRLISLSPEHCVIVTSIKYDEMSKAELSKAPIDGAVLSEPRPKNTAAAVLYAAIYLDKLYSDSIMIILPADHYIKNNNEFIETLNNAVIHAKAEKLVTIGINPTYPETGYGYIKSIGERSDGALNVDKFVEKPDLETAKAYLESGDYFWNSGIFIWKTSTVIKVFEKLMPGHINSFKSLQDLGHDQIKSNDSEIWKIKQDLFDSIESISIDYGIMEKAENRVVIPGDFGWADLGSWKSIDDILTPDDDSNRSPESKSAIFLNSKNCSVFSEDKRVSIVGLSNVVVVQAGDEILVIDKDSSQDVKKVVDIVKKMK